METYDIRHRVGIHAPKAQVLAKLNTIEGLSTWWTRDTTGDPRVGGSIEFFFGRPDPGGVMQVVESTNDRVVWLVIGGPDEWVGNTISFDLEQSGDETVVNFTHAWREPVEFMAHCSTKWGFFLLGMKASVEDGKGTPFPGELQISSWG